MNVDILLLFHVSCSQSDIICVSSSLLLQTRWQGKVLLGTVGFPRLTNFLPQQEISLIPVLESYISLDGAYINLSCSVSSSSLQ